MEDLPKTASLKIARHELKLIANELTNKIIQKSELFGRKT